MEKKEWKLKDVKGKTIFDICKDEELLKMVTGYENPYENKSFIEGYDALAALQLIGKYARLMDDEGLAMVVKKAEDNYWSWREKIEKAHPGLIID